ncbi:RagB/SusD family nutrient uptake outer membrane protein [Pontibacter vulgaris]|uniref:RagB/SusD family nutrient uptake outer membrane protein n=1 Tax=Pontibacter vulgaris TaxID=2905679 RepID=UPI001FA77D43|nr:RagB/SusD family nutrient uptake outer membrane protein [Pontibacter vulgaris]
MKRKYIYMLAIGLMSFASCESELDQEPFSALSTGQAFKTEADFVNALRGAYTGLRGATYYGGQDGGSMIITPDIISDNLIINSQGRFSQQTTYQLNYTANNTWNIWNNAYTTILRTNYILENIDNLPEGAAKNNIKAEALALRALSHFDLLRTYGKRYIGATDSDLGVPYVTSTDPSQKPSRTPLKKAYDLMVADFLAAESGINSANGVGRLNKAAVQGLLGRVYLYMGQWQNSVDKSTAAIANVPAANALATRAEFPAIWTDATEKDVLFKVKILDTDATPAVTVGVGYQQTVTGNVRAEYSPTCELVKLYQANDIRTTTYIGQSTYSGLTAKYVKKHVGRATGALNVVDVKVIRLSEVYLNRAEALYNLGAARHVEALADLNEIRSRRYDANVPLVVAGQELYDAILTERRLELAFEGHRFFDLKRLNLPIERSATEGDAADCSGVVAPATARSLPAGNFRWELPIPQAEIDANENIVQNSGY